MDIYQYISEKPHIGERHSKDPHHLSRWPILFFFITAFLCLLFSSAFHLFCCQNKKVNDFFQRLDHAGISLVCVGSAFPPFVYTFYCQPFFYKLYLIMFGTASLIVFVVCLFPFIYRPENNKLKGAMFITFVATEFLPVIHMIILS